MTIRTISYYEVQVNLKPLQGKVIARQALSAKKKIIPSFLIFRNTSKWRTKHVCAASMAFVIVKPIATEHITRKSLWMLQAAKR